MRFAPLSHVKKVKRVTTLQASPTNKNKIRNKNKTKKERNPAGFPTGPFYLDRVYSVIIIMQQPPGQHEPPPQQSFSLLTGVAAVSPIRATSISTYFINSSI